MYGNPKTGTFTKSEDPDEMLHNAAFHQGLHCLLRYKNLHTKHTIFVINYDSPLDMYNGLSQVCLSNEKEESISIERVKY